MKTVDIYTDGACSGNPGRGGYGAILSYNGVTKEISEGFSLTTNNRMEILAVIRALSLLKEKCNVRLFSDSKYVIDMVNQGWIEKWKSNNWMRTPKEKAKNIDLLQKFYELIHFHNVEFIWVKGHAGHKENEICDRLAVSAYNSSDLKCDEGFDGQ